MVLGVVDPNAETLSGSIVQEALLVVEGKVKLDVLPALIEPLREGDSLGDSDLGGILEMDAVGVSLLIERLGEESELLDTILEGLFVLCTTRLSLQERETLDEGDSLGDSVVGELLLAVEDSDDVSLGLTETLGVVETLSEGETDEDTEGDEDTEEVLLGHSPEGGPHSIPVGGFRPAAPQSKT